MRFLNRKKGIQKILALFVTLTMILGITYPAYIEASGGSYALNFKAADPDDYNRFRPDELSPRFGRDTNPINGANFVGGVESLTPEAMMLGQIVPFHVQIAVDGSTAPENGVIDLGLSFATELNNGAAFGFDPVWGVHSAFIDTSESTDPGANATAALLSDEIKTDSSGIDYIEASIRVSGLDQGDKAVLEIWVVLMDHITDGIKLNSNVQSSLLSAKTASDDKINVGKQTIPLKSVDNILKGHADASVKKTDNPDPIIAGQDLTYTITVKNTKNVAANGVAVTDILDPNVTFLSASDGGTASGQTVTWPLFHLAPTGSSNTPDPNSVKTLTVTVRINANAPTENITGTATDNRGTASTKPIKPYDILNQVSVALLISKDKHSDNNYWQEPTNVLGGKGKLTLSGKKKLEGRKLKAGEFTFDLYEGTIEPGETPIRTAVNGSNGAFVFDDLHFTQADIGTKTYTVVERGGSLPGIEYSMVQHTVVVEISLGNKGLNIHVTSKNANSLDFKNDYKATGQIQLSGKKQLKGRDPLAGEFTFELFEGSIEDGETPIATTTNGSDGMFSFSPLTFTLADVGTKTYSIRERNDGLGGVSYDNTVHKVVLQISDKGDGTLWIKVKEGKPQDLKFHNKYQASGELVISGLKKLMGRPLKAGEFTFALYEGSISPGELPIQTTTNDSTGLFAFTALHFSLSDVGTKTYTVIEEAGSLPGVEYDETVHTIEVKISDKGDGTLKFEVKKGQVKDIRFINEYKADGSLNLSGKKKLSGRSLTAGEFWFELYEGEVKIAEATNDADGHFSFETLYFDLDDVGYKTFTVVERDDGLGSIEYDPTVHTVSVQISDKGDGKLEVKVLSKNARSLDFKNKYKATGHLDIGGEKFLDGRDLNAGEFWFELYEDELLIDEVSNHVEGWFNFDTLYFSLHDVGKKTYYVKERAGSLGGVDYDPTIHKITVTIKDAGDGTLDVDVTSDNLDAIHFYNEYQASGSLQLSGRKYLTGRGLKAGEFWFELHDGESMIDETSHNSEGWFAFDTLYFDLDDVGTKTLYVQERDGGLGGVDYDPSIHTVNLEISDNGDGTLKIKVKSKNQDALDFHNKYEATGELTLYGQKNLEGRDLRDGEFWFDLYRGELQIDEATNDTEGAFMFETLMFTLDDLGSHTLEVTERAGSLGGVTYDPTVHILTLEISDNGDGTLDVAVTSENAESIVFNNDYQATGELMLSGQKFLSGRTLLVGEFWFELRQGEAVLQEMANGEGGGFAFESLHFTLDDVGTKTFTVVEREGTLPGITYDPTVHEVIVEIWDRGDGTLDVSVLTENETALDFHNEYALVDISVTKIWTGPVEAQREIQIQLLRNGVPYLAPVTLPIGQTMVVFEDLPEYDEFGDLISYRFEVAVPTGFMKSISADGLTITNIFLPPPLPQTGTAQKTAASGILLLLGGLFILLMLKRRRRGEQR